MSSGGTTELFACTPEQFYSIVSDYEKYPEFLHEVKACRILKVEGDKKLVEYQVNLIKNFTYVLSMKETPPHEVSWEFSSGDIFKAQTGYWKIQDEAGKARVTYHVDAKFKLLVPKFVEKTLVNVNLPNMMSAYHKRVSQLYGGA